MARPRFTTEAWRDLEEIVSYIGARNSSAAIRLTDWIEEECHQLASNPGIGQLRPDLLPGIRLFQLGAISFSIANVTAESKCSVLSMEHAITVSAIFDLLCPPLNPQARDRCPGFRSGSLVFFSSISR